MNPLAQAGQHLICMLLVVLVACMLQVVLVALRQARPRGSDGMGRRGRPLRRSTRRDEFHLMETPHAAIRCALYVGPAVLVVDNSWGSQ